MHPKFNLSIDTKKGKETLLTTYDIISTSPTKLKYSFGISKNVRFQNKTTNNDLICYDLPSTKSTRAAGFGIGRRFADTDYKLRQSK